MKVRSKLYLLASMVFGVMVIMNLSLFWAYYHIDEALQRDRYIVGVLKSVSGLSHQLRSVIDHGEAQAFVQWQQEQDGLQLLLTDMPDFSPKLSGLLKSIEQRNRGIVSLFQHLESQQINKAKKQRTRIALHLADKAFFQMEAIREDGFHLLALSRAEIEEVILVQAFSFIGVFILVTLMMSVVAVRLSGEINRSLRRLIRGLTVAGKGAFDTEIPEYSDDEIGELAHHFNKMLARLKTTTVSRDKLRSLVDDRTKELQRLTETDTLTGIANRRYYDYHLAEHIASSKRNKSSLAMLMIDIDFFKGYNDGYGHDAGDLALKQVAESISKILPRETDVVARFGGEEFVVVMPATEISGACLVGERIRLHIRNQGIPHLYSEVDKVVTVSIGVAAFKSDMLTEINLLKQADAALYEAKKNGRNQCVVHDDGSYRVV